VQRDVDDVLTLMLTRVAHVTGGGLERAVNLDEALNGADHETETADRDQDSDASFKATHAH
jgi:hypothetical protein